MSLFSSRAGMLAGLLQIAVAGACVDGNRDPGAATDQPAANASSETGREAAGTPTPSAQDTSSMPSTSRPHVALAPDGLTLVSPDGRTRHLLFGTDAGLVSTALGNVMSPPEIAENTECNLTVFSWENGLAVYAAEGAMVGWAVNDTAAPGTLSTMAGVGPGSTLEDLTAAYDAERLEDSSLGVEYSAGDMAVILSGEGADARITNMWAGSACIAR